MNLISIIICTHNRVNQLLNTLGSLAKIQIPTGTNVELLIIDNASNDDTAEISKSYSLPNMMIRYIFESKLGLSNARNRGISESRGAILVFIDDDVRPMKDWLVNLYSYMVSNDVYAVAGNVVIPEELNQPWMTSFHRKKLASTEENLTGKTTDLVGANMAFYREVFDRVPEFDPELGAGALGFGEETLFSLQLSVAGFNIGFAENATVVHYFDITRLKRRDWFESSSKRGKSKAYIDYHWNHKQIPDALYNYYYYIFRLLVWRMKHGMVFQRKDGCSVEEMNLVRNISYYKQYVGYKKKIKKYNYRSLRKLKDTLL